MADQKMKQQIKREIELVGSFKKCSRPINPNNIKTTQEQKTLKEFTNFSFHNSDVMEELFCAFDTYVTVTNPKDYTANKNVRNLFRKLRQIGADSVEGFALFAGFKEIQDIFVIKVPRDQRKDFLFHEYFIGVSCLNKLRRIVPNFSYIFGTFNCSAPEITEDKKVSDWCEIINNGVNYVIFEKISGPSMKDVAEDIASNKTDFLDYLSYLIQTFLALRIAWGACSFTHYDLHDENILIRKIPNISELYIPYKISETQTIYIHSDGIPTLIDYGRSYVALDVDGKTESFGYFGFESFGLFPNKSRPLHDVYKIIGFSMFSVASYRTNAADDFLLFGWQLLEMWPHIRSQYDPQTADDIRIVLAEERERYFELGSVITSIEKHEDPIGNVIETIKENYEQEWEKISFKYNQIPDNGIILDCKDLTCERKADIKKELTGSN